MKSSSLLCTLIIAVFVINGCDSGTDSGPSLITQPPKAGSTYTFHSVDIDSLGGQVLGSDRTFMDSVMETDLSYNGKNRVMKLTRIEDDFILGGEEYFNFEPNGDISEFVDFGSFLSFPSLWITFPIQSRQAKTYTIFDTTLIVGGTSTRLTSTITVSYAGMSTMTIHDSTLTLIKVKILSTNKAVPDPQQVSASAIAYFYFAPSIGYIAQSYQEPYKISDQPYHNGEDIRLVDYVLR
jgi:hypothetical protein